MENMSLGTFIKNARLAKGYSQKNLSDPTGIALSTIRRIEADKSIPRLSTLTLICSALDIDLNDTLKQFGYIKVENSIEESISLGNFIKNARLAKGYSQRNLSDLTGITQSSIWQIETDKSIPRLSTLKLICSALDIDLNDTLKQFGYINAENSIEESISLGNFIKNARLAKGYSQRNLSHLTGIGLSTISIIEADKSIPRLSTLRLICSALDIDYNKAVVLRAKSL